MNRFQLFQRISNENPDYRSKVTAIPGDCSLPDLGLSLEHHRLLTDNVNVVFHGAATVKFDENLKIALEINVFGTREILKCCREMKQLKVFYILSIFLLISLI